MRVLVILMCIGRSWWINLLSPKIILMTTYYYLMTLYDNFIITLVYDYLLLYDLLIILFMIILMTNYLNDHLASNYL